MPTTLTGPAPRTTTAHGIHEFVDANIGWTWVNPSGDIGRRSAEQRLLHELDAGKGAQSAEPAYTRNPVSRDRADKLER